MIKHLIAWYMEHILYKLPQQNDPKLFCSAYTDEQKRLAMGMLRSLIHENSPAEFSCTALNAIGRKVFNVNLQAVDINPLPIKEHCCSLNKAQRFDIEMLAVLLTLSHPAGLKDRINRLLPNIGCFTHKGFLKPILNDLLLDRDTHIQNNHILGKAYHNQKGMTSAMREFGVLEYRRQMNAMKKNKSMPHVQKEYDAIAKLPNNTVGALMMKYFKDYNLTIFGGKGALPSYFLWHELSHALSQNPPHFKGELNTNAFTVGYCSRGKMEVMIFGLFNWSLGIKTSVIAMPMTNKLCKPGLIDEYLDNIIKGQQSTVDILELSYQEQFALLHEDLQTVLDRYNIKTV